MQWIRLAAVGPRDCKGYRGPLFIEKNRMTTPGLHWVLETTMGPGWVMGTTMGALWVPFTTMGPGDCNGSLGMDPWALLWKEMGREDLNESLGPQWFPGTEVGQMGHGKSNEFHGTQYDHNGTREPQ